MKRTLFTLLFSLITAAPAFSFNYEEARQRAWYLTDKMAYELNLSPEQYDRAYQTNLDYFMNLNTAADCYGYAWSYREADLRCILFDWQYSLYTAADYFVRPVRWLSSAWYWPVFERYASDRYYFSRPSVYTSYRGGMWAHRAQGAPSPYASFRPRYGEGMRNHYGATGWRPDFGGRDVRPANQSSSGWRPDFGGQGNRPAPGNGNRPNNGYQGGNQGGYQGNGRDDRPSAGTDRNQPTTTRPSTGYGRGNTSTTRPSTGLGSTGNTSTQTERPTFNRNQRSGQTGSFNRTSGSSQTQQTGGRSNTLPTTPQRGNSSSGTVNRGHGSFTPSQSRGNSSSTSSTPSRSMGTSSTPSRSTNAGGRTFGR